MSDRNAEVRQHIWHLLTLTNRTGYRIPSEEAAANIENLKVLIKRIWMQSDPPSPNVVIYPLEEPSD